MDFTLTDNPLDGPDVPAPRFAIVYAPGRKRGRVPEQTVQVVDDEATARLGAAAGKGFFAAEVVGPLRSSEGFRVYFIRRWL